MFRLDVSALALGLLVVTGTSIYSLQSWAQAHRRPSLESCATFVNNDQIGVRLLTLQTEFPDIVRAFALGSSVSGRELWAVLISSEPDAEEPEPEVRIIGGIHGDECMSVEVVLEAAQFLAEDYGVDPEVSAIVDGAQILLIPSVNPDGRARLWASRTNENGVDLNRNLSFAWVDRGGSVGEGPHPFSEPETVALREISQQQSFDLGLSYHTQSAFVNGPWNYTPYEPDDADLISSMAEAYAGDAYIAQFGWDWYNINGDVNDWSLGTRGTFDFTIELRRDLFMEWDLHREALLRFLDFVHHRVQGAVADARSGEPLSARIEVNPETTLLAPVFTDPRVGDFHRILLEGAYTLRATAQGYRPLVIDDVVVDEEGLSEVDLALEPLPNGSQEFAFAINGMTLPEPIDNEVYGEEDYLNQTVPWSALGPPDGRFYSMSPGGSITFDLGEEHEVLDSDGPDLEVVSGTESHDLVAIAVASAQDGPFVGIGEGSGTFGVDLDSGRVSQARFVRLIDISESPFNDAFAGYDVDAIINLSPRPRPGIEPDGDADADADFDADPARDADFDGDSDQDHDTGRTVDADPEVGPDHDADHQFHDGDADPTEIDRDERGCGCGASNTITSRFQDILRF